MSFLKFNKAELVNLSYSLKREIISANKTGAYCNTSILTCNTRRYHGLLAVTLDRFGGDRFLLLSSVDESLILGGKQFNLGIHCYGDIYEPRGHKYVIDFKADPVPVITYKVGELLFSKSIILAPDNDQVLIKYELLKAPSKVTLQLRPFLAFRNIHSLTHENNEARLDPEYVNGGVSFRMYANFPDLYLQTGSSAAEFTHIPDWYKGVTYSDEARRGFDCREDLFSPGHFQVSLKEAESFVFSASVNEAAPKTLKRKFNSYASKAPEITNHSDQLRRCADSLITNHNNRKKINAGLSWMYTGLLRETLMALPGLTLYAGKPQEFEEILDNLISDESERLFHRTTQVESPLYLAFVLQRYIEFGANPEKVWGKYGSVLKGVIESYLPGERKEVAMQPNGLLWAEMRHTALSWMNAYVDGVPVTERAGYQVETNALWYNAVCFFLEMEEKYGRGENPSLEKWRSIRELIKSSFQPVFWNERMHCLADYVDANGQNTDIRPNQLCAICLDYSPVDPCCIGSILQVIDSELVTRRGIRTLSPRDPKYKGVYEGTQLERDLAYHQGSTRPFLLAPYAIVCFKVKGAAFLNKAEWLIKGFFEDLGTHGVGAFSELYDADPPHEPHGAISSALSTAALLTVKHYMKLNREEDRE